MLESNDYPNRVILTSGAQAISIGYFIANGEVKATIFPVSGAASYVGAEGTDYSLSGFGNENGGTLTTIGLAVGDTVVVDRDMTFTQSTNLPAGGPFNETDIEQALDELTMNDQQLKGDVDSAIKLPVSETPTDSNSRLPALVANKLIGLDAAKNLKYYDPNTGTPNDASAVTFTQQGIGAAQRTLEARNYEEIRVSDFIGVDPTGVTDSTAGINAAANAVRLLAAYRFIGNAGTANPHHDHGIALVFSPGLYRCDGEVWFGSVGDYDDYVKHVVGNGATIVSHNTGGVGVNLAGAYGCRYEGLTIFGDSTNTPDVTMLCARVGTATTNPSAGAHEFHNFKIIGNANVASYYNYGSEVNRWFGGEIRNSKAASKASVYLTCDNHAEAVTSENATIDTDSYQSSYSDFFIGTRIHYDVEGTGSNAAVIVESVDYGPRFTHGYFDLLQGATVSPPVITAQAATGVLGSTAKLMQSILIESCIIENDFDALVLVKAGADLRELRVAGCTLAGSAAVTADIVVESTGALRGADIQKYRGSTVIGPMTYSILGTLQRQVLRFTPIDTRSGYHYDETDLTHDGSTWDTLDLASDHNVPINAEFVDIKVRAAHTSTVGNTNYVRFRGDSGTSNADMLEIIPQVDGLNTTEEGKVPVVNGQIQVNAATVFGGQICDILIKGYYA